MPQATPVDPDLQFIRELKGPGTLTFKKCFQCATCSVVCSLSPEDHPFPRKEMVWAQWGLRQRLLDDPDIWLCHQCNDCSKHCPRGAKPGDTLAALRRLKIRDMAGPRFLGRMLNEPKFLPVAFAIPVLLLLLFMTAAGTLHMPEGEIVYRNFIPQWPVVDVLFPLTALWAAIWSVVGVRRLWRGFRAGPRGSGLPETPGQREIVAAVLDIMKHGNLRECVVNVRRYLAHFNMFWGFILLGVTTTCVAAGVYLFHEQTPYSLTNPIKWIGNLGGIILVAGTFMALAARLSPGDDIGETTYFDWLFLLVLASAGVTGLLTETLRLVDVRIAAYLIYFIHLVLVWFLFAYLPFSKFAHALYRTTALVYAAAVGRGARKHRAGPPGASQAPVLGMPKEV